MYSIKCCHYSIYRIDGNSDYRRSFVPQYLKNLDVYDVGGVKNPVIEQPIKKRFALTIVGLDIDKNELEKAPAGAYDTVI